MPVGERLDGFAPDLVARLRGVETVEVHHALDEVAVLVGELRGEVFVEDGLVVCEVLDDLVGGGALVSEAVAAREDAVEQDLRVRPARSFAECAGRSCG